jgi:cytochrome c oxidase subunit IV
LTTLEAHAHGAAAPAHGGHAHVSKRPLYIKTFLALTAMTAAEVGLTFVMHGAALIIMLAGFAIAKAGLVAAIFMHLKFERRTLVLIILLPILFAAILIIGLMPDSALLGLHRQPGTPSFRGG